MNLNLLESLPIASVFVLIAILMLAFGEVGYQYGVRAQSPKDKAAPNSLGPMVGALLGMLAFVLAFTFSMAISQHDLRKQNVLADANSIGTAYMRSDLIDKQYATEVKRLLREYVDIRFKATNSDYLETALAKSVEIHNLLWAQVVLAAGEHPNTNTMLMIQSINDVIDMHEKRVIGGLHNSIPSSVWFALGAIISLTMITMGVQVGLTGKRRLVAVIPLILAFAVLVTLVVDLNRPQSGLIKVGQQAMVDLRSSIDRETK
jgi:hypothetical protein